MPGDHKESDEEKVTSEQCVVTQYMIDITENQLNSLRTICRTEDETTQQEICESESKLIKLFGKQLVAKTRLRQKCKNNFPEKLNEYPRTGQFLSIVGLEKDVINGLLNRDISLETLLEMQPKEVERLLRRYNADPDALDMLTAALKNLRLWTDHQLNDEGSTSSDIQLHWSTYKSASSSPYGGNSPNYSSYNQRPSTSSLPADTYYSTATPTSPPTPPKSTPSSPFPDYSPAEHRRRLTPPATPPVGKPSKGKFPTTPPPQKKNKLYPDAFHPLIKSKSHESHLSVKVSQDGSDTTPKSAKSKPPNLSFAGSTEAISPRKKSADGSMDITPHVSRGPSGQSSPATSPKRSPPFKHLDAPMTPADDVHPKKNTLVVPASPTPMGPRTCMMHSINHRFSTKPIFGSCDLCHRHVILGKTCKTCKFTTKMVMAECNLCHRHVFRGRVCKDCKQKFHKECAAKAAPACGLPNELIDVFMVHLGLGTNPESPSVLRHQINHTVSLPMGSDSNMVHASSVPIFQPPDSGSNTSGSCNSSTPSSPAHFNASCATPSSPASHHHLSDSATSSQFHSQFTFPEITSDYNTMGSSDPLMSLNSTETASSTTLTDSLMGSDRVDVVNTNTSNDSDKSDKTLVDTGSSGENRPSVLDRVDSTESGEDGHGLSWSRVNSMSIKEWDIPYEELQFGEKIGDGRFGSVYKGNWHGDVAIKMLNMDSQDSDAPTDNSAQLQQFKMEIAMLRKTRHENLVLFMGACMNPLHLAIVTSLCKHQTLYSHIHMRKEKFAMNRIIIIASQIAQGMGYLHAKGIVHKDLKSKNIFIENGKVVITDFGLFSVTKLCHGNRKGEWLSIPPGWLCYLAPEIIRSLQAFNHMDLPFSKSSDVYAFGTVWYELLCGEWPFRGHPPESIIWQVGRGMKQSLGALHASRDVKDVLMMCWAYSVDERPNYSQLLKMFERLPRKRLARCPSHPIQLSRSAESVF